MSPAPPSCPDDVVLAGQDDIARFAGCITARAVTIRTAAPLDTTSLALASITGDLVIGPSVGLEGVTLNRLHSVGRIHLSSNQSLRGLMLPRLEAAGAIEIAGNSALTTIAMPQLGRVAAAVTIIDNPELELIDLPALGAIGGALVIADHPKLAAVELARLTSAASVRIEGVPALPVEVAEALRALPEAIK